MQKLIVLRRAHPVFRRRQYLRGTDEDGSGLPDVWWFRTDGHRMTKTDWESGHRTVGMFLNGEEIASPDTKGERILDESFLLLFNAHHEDVTFTLPNRRFGERWALVLSTTDPDAEPNSIEVAALEDIVVGVALAAPAAAAMTELRATYRLQLGGGFGFAQARELVPYLADLGVSHLYLPPSFQARPGSMHGYDVVDPTRISEELGGEAEFRALVAAAREAGLGVILDIVPNHMATDDANRYWTEQRAKFFDIDPETGRHRRFFDIDHLAGVRQEDPEVFEETHRLALALVREGSVDGLRIDHPDGLADPAGYLERLRAAGVRHVWVEKILDPGEELRAWPVEGTVGYEFLNDAAALFVDPAGEERLTALWDDVASDSRAFADHAAEAKLEQATTTFDAEVERLRRLFAARRPAGGALLAAGLPHLHPRRSGGPRGPRGPARGGDRVAARRPARVRDALPADHPAGDGEGGRGHRVLPLPAAARAQRRRRRPGALRHHGRGLPRGERASGARTTCSSPRRTTRSARATCGRASARSRGWRTSGRRTCAAGSS